MAITGLPFFETWRSSYGGLAGPSTKYPATWHSLTWAIQGDVKRSARHVSESSPIVPVRQSRAHALSANGMKINNTEFRMAFSAGLPPNAAVQRRRADLSDLGVYS